MKPIKISDDIFIINDMPRGWKNEEKWRNSLYYRWRSMWLRCYNKDNSHYRFYKDCEVDDRYKYFSNYIKDIMTLENFDAFCDNPSNWEIDKDKKNSDSKIYCLENLSIISKVDNLKISHPCKAIKGTNIKDGSIIILNSVNEALELGFKSPGNISSCLKGRLPHYKGYKWEYVEED